MMGWVQQSLSMLLPINLPGWCCTSKYHNNPPTHQPIPPSRSRHITTSMSSWMRIPARNCLRSEFREPIWTKGGFIGPRRSAVVHFDPAVAQRVDDCCCTVVHRELFQDRGNMVFHRLIANLQ